MMANHLGMFLLGGAATAANVSRPNSGTVGGSRAQVKR